MSTRVTIGTSPSIAIVFSIISIILCSTVTFSKFSKSRETPLIQVLIQWMFLNELWQHQSAKCYRSRGSSHPYWQWWCAHICILSYTTIFPSFTSHPYLTWKCTHQRFLAHRYWWWPTPWMQHLLELYQHFLALFLFLSSKPCTDQPPQ